MKRKGNGVLLCIPGSYRSAHSFHQFPVTFGSATGSLTKSGPGTQCGPDFSCPSKYMAQWHISFGDKAKIDLWHEGTAQSVDITIGKLPGDDWHFDIQHIGAQTRFLRQSIKGKTLVVAYLENSLKSWPAWRRNTAC